MESLSHNLEAEQNRGFALVFLKPLGMQLFQDQIVDILKANANILIDRTVIADEDRVARHYRPIQFKADGTPTAHFPAMVKYLSGKETRIMIVEDDQKLADSPHGFSRVLKDKVLGYYRPEQTREGHIRNLVIANNIDYMQPAGFEGDIPEGVQSHVIDNLIHSSDSLDSALHEIRVWFEGEDIYDRFSARYDFLQSR